MPPQPLSRVKPDARVIAGPGQQTFDRRPAFASYVAQIIAQWSYCEANLRSILTVLLSAEAGPVTAMVEALRSSTTQFDMIKAAALSKLIDPELASLEAVMALARKGARGRNRIAHDIWAFSDDLPDAIILVQPEGYSQIFVDLQKYLASPLSAAPLPNVPIPFIGPSPDKCFVYKEADFREILDDFDVISKCTTFLFRYLQSPPGSPQRDQEYSRLSASPDFQTALFQTLKRRPIP
jgi:hypothetical protein